MLTLGYFTYSCIFAKFVRIDVKNIENTLGNLIKCMDDLFFPTTRNISYLCCIMTLVLLLLLLLHSCNCNTYTHDTPPIQIDTLLLWNAVVLCNPMDSLHHAAIFGEELHSRR